MADEGEGSQLILWARNESNRLTNLGTSNWIASGEVSAAVEFLRKFAGPQSAFAQHAEESYSREVGHMAARSVVAGLLRWADFKEHGLAQELPIEVRIRIEAANDLMGSGL